MNRDISFIIITNGKKPSSVINQVKSLERLKINKSEVVISGYLDKKTLSCILEKNINVKYFEDKDSANLGKLGKLRNTAADKSSFNFLVVSDDDMLFPSDWYKNLSKINEDFDISTTTVKLPDGTRFWDKCCYQSPTNGHKILNYDEKDDFLYMSGGQSWIMKKNVFEKHRWDENIAIYNMSNLSDYASGMQNEDTEYSSRCRKDFEIKHFHKVTVFHDDPTYTSFGRIVRRRSNLKSAKWCKDFLFPEKFIIPTFEHFFNLGFQAEAFDILRISCTRNSSFRLNNNSIFEYLFSVFGPPLENSNFSISFEEYEKAISF